MSDTTRAARRRRRMHATRLARQALYAGPNQAVAKVLGVSPSRACHLRTDEVHPTLRDAMDLMMRCADHPEVDGLAVLEAMEDAWEIGALVERETEPLINEGCALLDLEAERDGLEDRDAVVGGLVHADALSRCWPIQRRLEMTIRELAARGIDLHAVYRERKR